MSGKRSYITGLMMLSLTAFIWGSAFVAQSVGMDNLGAFTFGGIRTTLGGLVLLVYILISEKVKRKKMDEKALSDRKELVRTTVRKGIVVGIVFFFACATQQQAFYYSTAGKIAFITALYIFFVPIFGLFGGKKISALTWVSILMAFAGLYFLSIGKEGLGAVNKGDILAFICSIFFAFHILAVDRVSDSTDGVILSCTQFITGGLITLVLMFIYEMPFSMENVKLAAVPILYSGIMSCGVAYTFQILGQKRVEPAAASLILSAESLFAVLTAAVILKEVPTPREALGCIIMFSAIILSNVSEIRKKKR